MRLFRHLLHIKFVVFVFLLFISNNVFAQSEKQQLRMARSLEKSREYESALKIYQNLENYTPLKNEVSKGIQNCLKGLQEYEKLIAYLEKIVNESSMNSKNANALAEAYVLNSQKDKAIEIWEEILTQNKNNIKIYRMIAGTMIQYRLLDEAIAVYEAAIKNLKNQQILHLDLANLHKSMLNMGQSAKHFLEYYGNYPKQKKFLQRQILNLAKSEQHRKAVAQVLNQYIAEHPKKYFLKEVLGGLYIHSKQFNSAFDIYIDLENTKNDGSYLYKFGLEAQKNEAYEYAVKTFEKILENEKFPIYTNAYYQLAKTHYLITLNNGELKESLPKAIKMFEYLADKNSIQSFSDVSCLFLGDIYIDFYFDLDKAITYYDQIPQKYPRSKKINEALIKLGDSYLIKGNMELSQKAYLKIRNKKNTSITDFKIAELNYYQGKFSEALKHYNTIIAQKGIGDSLANNALERTIFINTFKSDTSDLKTIAFGEQLIFQKKYSEAVEHLNKLLEKQNDISSSAGKIMVNVLMKLEKYEEANVILKELIEEYPEDYYADEFLFKSAMIEEIMGNFQRAFELYQTLLNEYETSMYYERARENARILNEKINKEKITG